jgi:hypothetical protein
MITLISIVVIAGIILFAKKFGFTGRIQFTKSNKIHLTILSIINLIIIGKLVSIAWDGNDKAIILVMFGYPALTILNGLIWLILAILKRPEYKIYKTSTIGLAILFIPTLIASSMY